MTVVSARSIITLGNAHPEQMREALEVLKHERDSDKHVIGVRQNPYDSTMESAEARIAWNGVVKANQYERKVEHHNAPIRESNEEEERLHELGLRAKAELTAAQAKLTPGGAGADDLYRSRARSDTHGIGAMWDPKPLEPEAAMPKTPGGSHDDWGLQQSQVRVSDLSDLYGSRGFVPPGATATSTSTSTSSSGRERRAYSATSAPEPVQSFTSVGEGPIGGGVGGPVGGQGRSLMSPSSKHHQPRRLAGVTWPPPSNPEAGEAGEEEGVYTSAGVRMAQGLGMGAEAIQEEEGADLMPDMMTQMLLKMQKQEAQQQQQQQQQGDAQQRQQQMQQRPRTRPSALRNLRKSRAGGGGGSNLPLPSFAVGARVEVRYGGSDMGEWYEARVAAARLTEALTSRNARWVYDIFYDDGDVEQEVETPMIRAAPEVRRKRHGRALHPTDPAPPPSLSTYVPPQPRPLSSRWASACECAHGTRADGTCTPQRSR